MKHFKVPTLIWLFFIIIAAMLLYFTNNLFYLFNFMYIGTFVAVGIFLFGIGNKYARMVVQFGVGLYMLVYLGFILRENMQLSGFFYYLFMGVFEAATIHYFVAKIAGPFLFGRGWCGYACWTAMILDLLPFKAPKSHNRIAKLGLLRYIVFAITTTFVAALFIFKVQNLERIIFFAFVIGNAVYYLVGISLAFILKDNRAFCKYFCPVTAFLKPLSYFSLLRVKWDEHRCIDCKKCVKVCPMDVNMLDNRRSRKNGTECILCGTCETSCPAKALKI